MLRRSRREGRGICFYMGRENMKRQKGQSILEFALVLPIFLFVLIGIMAFGMYFSDFIALNSIARSVAREASLLDNTTTAFSTINDRYVSNVPSGSVKETYYLPNAAYTWDPADTVGGMIIKQSEKNSSNVRVTLKAKVVGSGPVHVLANLMGDNSFLTKIEVEYEMYWEKKPTTTTTSTGG